MRLKVAPRLAYNEKMIADWLIDTNGKLQMPLVLLYSALTGLPEKRLKTIVFALNGSKKNKAETWGVNKIRINPEAYTSADDPAWIGTLAHELTHEYHYFKSLLPDCIIRFFDQFGIKFRQYILGMPHEKAYKASRMEKQAFAVQAIIMDFVKTYTPQKTLADNTLSEQEKVQLLLNMAEEYKLKKWRGSR
ncbi:MAG TPA: hypothetical protein PLB59_05805 [Bacteroidales bacterium]|nr:hypothetical protein [Bacteroidales bacterium]HPI29090.1 hypothetical protein [Bacteroidales bacterium]HQN15826.1 hypothetical protein [Bacteroidales bacterium]HQP15462.1 hypothetical protein [Bacteroidales bacterium]